MRTRIMSQTTLLLSAFVANLFCYSFLSVKGKNNHSCTFGNSTELVEISSKTSLQIDSSNKKTLPPSPKGEGIGVSDYKTLCRVRSN